MKFLTSLLLMILLSSFVSARNIHNISYHHPRSEPKGLYIVSFDYDRTFFEYRVYCPNGDVREITNDRWDQARKAHKEDRIKFEGQRVVREAVDYVCGY